MSKTIDAQPSEDVSFEPLPPFSAIRGDTNDIARILEETAALLRVIREQAERPLPVIA